MVGFDGCGLFFCCIDIAITIDLIERGGCGQFAITIESIVYCMCFRCVV